MLARCLGRDLLDLPTCRFLEHHLFKCKHTNSVFVDSPELEENVRERLRYAVGSSGFVVNIRTFTTHIGFVIIAVTAPKAHIKWSGIHVNPYKFGVCELASAEHSKYDPGDIW